MHPIDIFRIGTIITQIAIAGGLATVTALKMRRPKLTVPTWKDWCQHWRIEGQWGAGKSTYGLHLIKKCLDNGKGCFVFDPHGTLAKDVLQIVPYSRIDDVVYNDPVKFPWSINPLKLYTNDGKEKDMVVGQIVSLVRQMDTSGAWGIKIERCIKNAVRKVLGKNNVTILDVIAQIDPNEDGSAASAHGRLMDLVDSESLHSMLTGPNQLDFRELLNDSKIYVLNMGGLDDYYLDACYRIHMIQFQQAIMSRGTDSPFCFLFADEAQRVSTSSTALERLLAECRKYNVSVALAHHTNSQMGERLRKLYDLIGNQVLFKLTRDDANQATNIIYPYTPEELQRMPNYHCIQRLVVCGKPNPPERIKTQPPPKPSGVDTTMLMKPPQSVLSKIEEYTVGGVYVVSPN